jgi:hypothetical protein
MEQGTLVVATENREMTKGESDGETRGTWVNAVAYFVRSEGPVRINIRCQTHKEAQEKWDAMSAEHPNQRFTLEAEPERASESESRKPVDSDLTPYGLPRSKKLSSHRPASSGGSHKTSTKTLGSSCGGSTRKKPKKKQGAKRKP